MAKSRSKSKARQDQEEWIVQPGTEVFDVDGRKIGGVTDIQSGDLIVHKGGLFAKDYRIPFSAVASHTDVRIDLSMSADEAIRGSESESVDTTTASSSDDAQIAASNDDVTTRNRPSERSSDVETVETTEVMRVPVVEEQLDASRHQVERGQVRLETNVTEREEAIEVPVTEERVRVQRIAVDRLATAADLAIDSRTLSVAVYGEEVDLQTQARVVEEIVISKDAIQEIREVSGTVRREDVKVVDETVTRDESITESTESTESTGSTGSTESSGTGIERDNIRSS